MSCYDTEIYVTARLPRGRKLVATVMVEFNDYDWSWHIAEIVEASVYKWQELIPYLQTERDVLGVFRRAIERSPDACADIETGIREAGAADASDRADYLHDMRRDAMAEAAANGRAA